MKKGFVRILMSNRKFIIGFIIFTVILTGGIIAHETIPLSYSRTGAFLPGLPPGTKNILGTDSLGRSIDVQLAEAFVNSIQIGLISAIIGTFIGAIIGFISGYYGGIIDSILRVLTDVFLSIPRLLFLILIASLMRGITVQGMALIIALFAWPSPARQIRAQVLSLKERGFVDLAVLSGMSKIEIIFRELVPHMFQWMGANFVNAALSAILAESGLSILGLGPQNEMTLGMMIYWALSFAAVFRGMWWWWGSAVLGLTSIFISLYLLHLGFDEVINSRIRL